MSLKSTIIETPLIFEESKIQFGEEEKNKLPEISQIIKSDIETIESRPEMIKKVSGELIRKKSIDKLEDEKVKFSISISNSIK